MGTAGQNLLFHRIVQQLCTPEHDLSPTSLALDFYGESSELATEPAPLDAHRQRGFARPEARRALQQRAVPNPERHRVAR